MLFLLYDADGVLEDWCKEFQSWFVVESLCIL